MAKESACRLQMGRDRHEGDVRMEADHIDFAGATKFRFRIAELTNPRRDSDVIKFSFHGNAVAITLENLEMAKDWIAYIQNPQTLADKLGVEQGDTVRVLNLADDEALITSLRDRDAKIVSEGKRRCDVVMIGVERAAELRQIGHLAEHLKRNGAIWVVLPKTARTVTKANVFAAAREVGMQQVKMLDFTDNRAAYKIVRPPAARKNRSNGTNGKSNGSHTATATSA